MRRALRRPLALTDRQSELLTIAMKEPFGDSSGPQMHEAMSASVPHILRR